jgi:two-component system KDP operon response regulator KdpE
MSPRLRVLVCDGEVQSQRALWALLRRTGFDVMVTGTGEAALHRAANHVPDAAIIELVLPDGDGVEVCRRLRDWSAMPLIVLSTIDVEEEKVRALEAGADDYVIKPVWPRELVGRLEAKLRRVNGGENPPRIALGGLEIDLAARVVRRDRQEIHLTPIEFKLLNALVQHRGRLLTNGVLLAEIWGAAYLQDSQKLRTHIANLRRKLGTVDGLPLICTHRGVGYYVEDGRTERRPQPVPTGREAAPTADLPQLVRRAS